MRSLDIWMYGQKVATVHDDGGFSSLDYEESWKDNPQSIPLSLSLPLDTERHQSSRVKNFVGGLIPENEAVLADAQKRYRLDDPSDPMEFLSVLGEEVAGAAQFVPPGQAPDPSFTRAPIPHDLLRQMVAEVRQYNGAMPFMKEPPHVSMAGFQAKVALHKSGDSWSIPQGTAASTHIIKPAPKRLTDVDLIEHAIMQSGREIGLNVSHTEIVHFESERAFVTMRYDRVIKPDGRVMRIHQEDFLQAMGRDPDRKYQYQKNGPSLPELINLIRNNSSNPDDDINEFVRLNAFHVITGDADGHAKNSSFILAPGSVRLAPAYDLQSSAPYPAYVQKLAFAIGRQFEYSRVSQSDWIQLAKRSKLDSDRVLSLVSDVWEKAPAAMFRNLEGLPSSIADPIRRVVESASNRMPR